MLKLIKRLFSKKKVAHAYTGRTPMVLVDSPPKDAISFMLIIGFDTASADMKTIDVNISSVILSDAGIRSRAFIKQLNKEDAAQFMSLLADAASRFLAENKPETKSRVSVSTTVQTSNVSHINLPLDKTKIN